jgi:hypothetical protein
VARSTFLSSLGANLEKNEGSSKWTGPTSQDPDRQKWGWDLTPGIYRTVSATVVREPCVFVLPIPTPLAGIGADRWVVTTRGRRK